MVWHIITGEYPPQLGGVSDYTYLIAQEFARGEDQVHVWSPDTKLEGLRQEGVQIHLLPGAFGWRWLRELDRRLRAYPAPRNILIQYVPHMYGWKSMNLAFCWWIFRQQKQNVCVMFHEVAFPFRTGRLRHTLLAVVHRIMAWVILRSVRHSFTSTEAYMNLLRTLGGDRTPISILRICSNIPMESYQPEPLSASSEDTPDGLFSVGIFSNFSSELRKVLQPAIGSILENPKISVTLLGPGESFRQSLAAQYPQAADRIESTGHLHVSEVGKRMLRSDALLQLYPDGASAARGTLISAMASGVPVVTTAGAATDTLLLNSGAMLFPSGSPQSIRDAIELLKKNPALALELRANAFRLYRESFQPAVIVSKIREAISYRNDKEVETEKASSENPRVA